MFNDQIKSKIILSILMGVIGIQLTIFADNGAAFLDNGFDSKSRSLGENYVAMADGTAAIYWNPAGLTGHDFSELSVTSYQAIETSYQSLSYARKIKSFYGGFQYVGASVDDILESSLNETSGDYEFTGNTLGYQGTAIMLSVAKPLKWNTSAGITTKYVSEALQDNRATGFGLDIGVRWKPSYWLTIGANAQNIWAKDLEWDTASQITSSLPKTIRAGGALSLKNNRLHLTMDGVKRQGRPTQYGVGAEWYLLEHLAVRGGIRKESQSLDDIYDDLSHLEGLSLGVGLELNPLIIDMSWSRKDKILDDMFRISLRFLITPEDLR